MNNRTPFVKAAFLAVPLALMLCPLAGAAAPFGPQSGEYSDMLIAQNQSSANPGKPGVGANPHQRFAEELGLSPEQSRKVEAIMAQGREQSRILRQQLKVKRQAMMQYLQSSSASEPQARTLNADINDLQRQLGEVRLKTWFAMRSQLTPEQLEKLKALKARHRENKSGGPGSHQGGPPDESF